MNLPEPLALAAARRILAQGGEVDTSTLVHLAQACRRAGALDEARGLLARLGSADSYTEALADIFNLRPVQVRLAADEAAPAPFVRLVNFLPPEQHDRIKAMTRAAMDQFAASTINASGGSREDSAFRQSAILPDSQPFAALFLPYVRAAVEFDNITAVLGTAYDRSRKVELQVTGNGDGAFFKAHTDTGRDVNRSRRITFTYYFNFLPQRFSGGSLLLYDGAPAVEKYASEVYTRIAPVDNSIVFFPSTVVHEVETVTAETRRLEDGRFTINGWFH